MPRLFTIAPSTPFLPTLARAAADGTLIPGFTAADPLAFARATLYLPTRRAVALARTAFLEALGGRAALLPRIVALGDIDEDELIFTGSGEATLSLMPAIGTTERRLALARLVLDWMGEGGADALAPSPTQALMLADDLARLIDDMATRAVSWDALDTLVPADVDVYWQNTLAFLKIARTRWPHLLAARGLIDPAARRDLLIAAEAAALQSRRRGPVIAAGSTGSMPATAALLRVIAALPDGAVVLPGLDLALDADEPALLRGDAEAPPLMGHPQYAMQALIALCGVDRDAVIPLGAPTAPARDRLVAEAMRPAATTERWRDRDLAPMAAEALADVTLIEAAHGEDEALALALVLREAAEHPGLSAALITPDRALARRVAAALERWDLRVPDTAGRPLSARPAGAFAQLIAAVETEAFAPAPLLALLKHPLFRLGRAAQGWRAAAEALECAVLRGVRPPPGLDGLATALAAITDAVERLRAGARGALHRSDPRAALAPESLAAAADLVRALREAFGDSDEAEAPLRAHAARHRARCLALSMDDAGASTLDRADGVALLDLLDDWIAADGAEALAVSAGDYADLFRRAADAAILREAGDGDTRIGIYGLLESRLASFDRVILAGLNEGTWPPQADNDAWLNRPMRMALGLDLPERRIGLSAHDFVQAMGARTVFLSRAARQGTTPTVASRFLQRLAAVAGHEAYDAARARGEAWLAQARALDAVDGPPRPAPRPSPRPPVALRPGGLSVTQIEDWLRDPYTIFARHILRLTPLDPVDMPLTASGRGTAVHEALAAFTRHTMHGLTGDDEALLIGLAAETFAALGEAVEARALWWPRFLRQAAWFCGWERERRRAVETVFTETAGAIAIPLGARMFRLSARADRIERLRDGRYAVLDYKTGAVPYDTEKQVQAGLAPQLPLEAAILLGGGFADLPPTSIAELAFVRLTGQSEGGAFIPIKFKTVTPEDAARGALASLTRLVTAFENPAQAYVPLNLPMWKNRYGTYDDLARIKEWSRSGGLGDEGDGE